MATSTEFDEVEETVSGPVIGWNYVIPGGHESFAELAYQVDVDDTLQFSSIRSGLLSPIRPAGPFDFRGRMDFGYSWGRYDPHQNLNRFLSLGLSIQSVLHLSDDISITGLFGYRFSFDQTSEQKCADGTTAHDEGAATCLDHGGLGAAHDRLGDGHGPEFLIGIRISH